MIGPRTAEVCERFAGEVRADDVSAAIMLLRFTLSDRDRRRRMVATLMHTSVLRQAQVLGVIGR